MDVAADGTSNGNSNDGEITVAWTALANATSYTVTVKDNLGVSVGTITSTGATSANVTGLNAQADYTVTVVANNGSVDSTVSDAKTVTTLKEFKYAPSYYLEHDNSNSLTQTIGGSELPFTNSVTFVYHDNTVGDVEVVVDTTGSTNREDVLNKIAAALATDTTLNSLVSAEYHATWTDWNNMNVTNVLLFGAVKTGSDVKIGLKAASGTEFFSWSTTSSES